VFVPELRPRNTRIRLIAGGGALALAVVMAIVLVARRPAAKPAVAGPAPTVVANPPPQSTEPPEALPAVAGSDDGTAMDAVAKGKTKPPKPSTTSKSRHHTSKRRDPVKW